MAELREVLVAQVGDARGVLGGEQRLGTNEDAGGLDQGNHGILGWFDYGSYSG